MSTGATMRRLAVTGISGIFVRAEDPEALMEWYSRNFGLNFHFHAKRGSYGTEFIYRDVTPPNPAEREGTVFVIEPKTYGDSSGDGVLLQFRVPNLAAFLKQLATTGVDVHRNEDFSFGRFARLKDLEGNEIELYEPA